MLSNCKISTTKKDLPPEPDHEPCRDRILLLLLVIVVVLLAPMPPRHLPPLPRVVTQSRKALSLDYSGNNLKLDATQCLLLQLTLVRNANEHVNLCNHPSSPECDAGMKD